MEGDKKKNKWVNLTQQEVIELLHRPDIEKHTLITIPDYPYLFKQEGDTIRIFKMVGDKLVEWAYNPIMFKLWNNRGEIEDISQRELGEKLNKQRQSPQ